MRLRPNQKSPNQNKSKGKAKQLKLLAFVARRMTRSSRQAKLQGLEKTALRFFPAPAWYRTDHGCGNNCSSPRQQAKVPRDPGHARSPTCTAAMALLPPFALKKLCPCSPMQLPLSTCSSTGVRRGRREGKGRQARFFLRFSGGQDKDQEGSAGCRAGELHRPVCPRA